MYFGLDMHPKDEEALETIDAMAFSGDRILDPDDRNTFCEYLRRWSAQVEVMQGLADDDDELDMEDDMDEDEDEEDEDEEDEDEEDEEDKA